MYVSPVMAQADDTTSECTMSQVSLEMVDISSVTNVDVDYRARMTSPAMTMPSTDVSVNISLSTQDSANSTTRAVVFEDPHAEVASFSMNGNNTSTATDGDNSDAAQACQKMSDIISDNDDRPGVTTPTAVDVASVGPEGANAMTEVSTTHGSTEPDTATEDPPESRNSKKKVNQIKSVQKPFACDSCEARFVRRANLKKHVCACADAKTFVCDMCGLKFARNVSLKAHVQHVHWRERAFPCRTCDARFVEKGQSVSP